MEYSGSVTAVVGANWGDEGKGKMTDYLAERSDVVVRFQGGNNAGHTVINDYGKFALHLLPSGVFYPHVTNVLGQGVAVNISALLEELKELEARGLKLKPVPAASVSAIMNSLSLAADDLIVVVYSANNVLPGETVEVDFELAVDHVVFRRGELITRATIEADVTRESLPQFFAYALSAVRAQALAHGMLPDIETGNIGVISASDIAGVADEIERIEGRRVLEIRAGKDFRTTDRLDSFQFVVKPARY